MPRPANRQEARDREFRAWRMRVRGFTEQRIADELGVSQPAVHLMLERAEKAQLGEMVGEALPIKRRQTAQLEYLQEEAMLAWERSKLNAETERTVEKSIAPKRTELEPQPQGGALVRTRRGPLEDFDPECEGAYLDDEGEGVEPEERARVIAQNAIEKALAHLDAEGGPVLVERTTTSISVCQSGDPRHLDIARKAMADIRGIWGIDAPQKQQVGGDPDAPLRINVVFDETALFGADDDEEDDSPADDSGPS